jgi:hypothetical protein
MSLSIKDGGAWKEPTKVEIKSGGVWKEVLIGSIKNLFFHPRITQSNNFIEY